MPYVPPTPIAIGSLAWGTPVNDRFANLSRGDATTSLDQDMLTWQFDLGTNMVATAITSGTISWSKLWLRQDETITNICAAIGTVGTGLTAGQNFAALYDLSGARLGVTADQTAAWGTVGFKSMALTAPVPVTAGYYYAAILSNATTATPAFARGSALTASIPNGNLTATNARFAVGPAAQTTMPLSVTMASRTLTGNALWAAFS